MRGMFSDMPLSLMVLAVLAGGLTRDLAREAGCGAARPCVVLGEQKAGKGADGVAQRVVHLRRGEGEAEFGQCIPEERWLVRAGKPPQKRLALSLCNDGYGSAGMGEDAVTVKDNRLVHDQYGGSAWRWQVVREFQLSPPRLLQESHTSFHTTTSQFADEWKWSWERFSGERVRTLSDCNEEGLPDLREEARSQSVKSALIPQWPLPAEFRSDGWKTTGLGACAALAPFVTAGRPGSAEDTSLRVLASGPTELWLEVTDDAFTPGDHLELWLTDELRRTNEGCLGPAGKQATQWLIALPGGKVSGGHRSTIGLPRVEVAHFGAVARVKLSYPPGDWSGVTVLYADSDDGLRPERVIATSQFRFAQSATLGLLHPVAPAQATCEVIDGVLTPRDRSIIPEKGPLFPPSGP